MASWKSDACMKSSVSAANSRPTKSVLRTSGWLYNATPTSSSKAASLSGARQRVRGPLRPSIARVVRLSPEPNPVLLFHFRRWRFFQFRARRVFVLLKFSLFGLGTGFYKVYGDFFEKIYANEMSFSKKLGLPLPKEAPVLGNLESPYAQVTAFYNYWLGFVTVLDFFWAD